MAVDPITLEVILSRLLEVVASMERLLFHSGYSPILRESEDGSACILDGDGVNVVGAGLPVHFFNYCYSVQAVLKRFGDDMHPGDSFMINDPYEGGLFHVPDVAVITPVFWQGRRVAFSASVAHKADVGGIVPGSSGAGSREIFHEGLLLPAVRFWTANGVNRDVEAIVRRNCRTPEETMGDLRAQVGCTRIGAQRITEVIGEYGLDVIQESFARLVQRSETLLRQELRTIPDGQAEAEGFLDDESVGLDHPARIHVRVRKQGDEIEFDVSGSDPQVPAPVNILAPGSETGIVMALLGLLDPNLPMNDGLRRPIKFVNPAGRVTNARHPAPVNNYFPTIQLLFSLCQRAIAELDPTRSVAPAGYGTGAITYGYLGAHSGRTAVQYELNPVSLGGSAAGDGAVAIHPASNYTPCQPIEILETEYPLQVLQFEPAVDSAGPGQFRGGVGFVREYRLLDNAKFTLRTNGYRYGPIGVAGGRPPQLARCYLNPGTPGERRLPCLTTLDLQPGDTVRQHYSGGAGWGDPLARDPERVLADVRSGYVSRSAAAGDYGVVLDASGEQVDEDATRRLRQQGPPPEAR